MDWTNTNKALDEYAKDSVDLMRSPLKGSRLINNIKVIKATNTKSILRMPSYAKWADSGRKPGKMPPSKPIEEWMKRKNIDISQLFNIRRKIGKFGTDGKDFFKIFLDEKTRLTSTISDAMAKDILNELLKKR